MASCNVVRTENKMLKSSEWGLEKSELPWEQNFFIVVRVFPVELFAYSVLMVCAEN